MTSTGNDLETRASMSGVVSAEPEAHASVVRRLSTFARSDGPVRMVSGGDACTFISVDADQETPHVLAVGDDVGRERLGLVGWPFRATRSRWCEMRNPARTPPRSAARRTERGEGTARRALVRVVGRISRITPPVEGSLGITSDLLPELGRALRVLHQRGTSGGDRTAAPGDLGLGSAVESLHGLRHRSLDDRELSFLFSLPF